MKAVLGLAAMATLLAVISVSQAQDTFGPAVPLLSCGGLPCVDATMAGGKHVRLLIDTGDVEALLQDSTANALALELLPVRSEEGAELPGYKSALLHGLTFGGAVFADVKVIVTDFKTLSNGHLPDADGFLTYPAFKNRLLRLDFVHKTLSVSAPLGAPVPCTGHCAPLQYPTFGTRGPPIVLTTAFSVNGKPVSAQIDTMFTGAMLVYPHAVQKLGFEKESRTTDKAFFPYTDGGVDMLRATVREVGFDTLTLAERPHLYFATKQVHAPDGMFDATVGLAALARAVVTFDFQDDWIAVSLTTRGTASGSPSAH